MDSKSVHRIGESMGVKTHFDTKLKLWTVGELKLGVDEVAKMSSLQLREKLTPKGGTVVLTGKQLVADSKDGDSSLAEAAAIVKATTRAIGHAPAGVEVTKKPKGKKTPKGDKPKRVPPKREAGVVKIDGKPAVKPKRVSKENEGKLWLVQFGIHKWALRNKAEAHEAPTEVRKLLAQDTRWYGASDMRQIVKHAIFTPQDKALLAKPEGHTAYAIKCATSARDIAEKVLAALS